jgi:hypothetical protein
MSGVVAYAATTRLMRGTLPAVHPDPSFKGGLGYDTATPTEAGTSGQADPVHFMSAIRAGRAVLTHNYDDFKLLYDLISLAGGHHPGVLVVRRDNDPTRDMASRTIVCAIDNLTAQTRLLPICFMFSTTGAKRNVH